MVLAKPIPMERDPCPGCGQRFPAVSTPGHRYQGASPGCWAVYGRVLARDYQDRRYWGTHGLLVDTYAAQHPGEYSRQSAQSVALHLCAMAVLLDGATPEEAMALRRRLAPFKDWPWLKRPDMIGGITILDVLRVKSPEAHMATAQKWAQSVWQAWSAHHTQIRGWIKQRGGVG